MQTPDNAFAVILAGGGGTRLWPKSRRKTPKHLLKLFGAKTLLEITYDRVASIIPDERIFVITHKDQLGQVKEKLTKLPNENFIAEPEAKNTALAMGIASAFVHKKDSNAAIIFLAADHIFKNVERFHLNALASLQVASEEDVIVSIGIKPKFPHTGLGYIKIGEELESLSKVAQKGFVFKVSEFKEKPNLVTAQSFIASGQYLWNANLYCWSSRTIFKAFEKFNPKVFKAMNEVLETSPKDLEQIYERVGDVNSIDYEVSEKADNIVVIPGDFGWSDIGDWKSVYDTHIKDSKGNVVIEGGEVLAIDTHNSLVESNGKLIVTIGLDNVVVVDTEDAILISSKDRAQDVKKAVEKLKEEKKEKYL